MTSSSPQSSATPGRRNEWWPDLPLIESSGGDHRFHDLWQAAFADVLAPAEWKPALAAGAEALVVRGELVRAALCLRTAGETARLVQVARRFASSSISAGLSRSDAEVLFEVLPEARATGRARPLPDGADVGCVRDRTPAPGHGRGAPRGHRVR